MTIKRRTNVAPLFNETNIVSEKKNIVRRAKSLRAPKPEVYDSSKFDPDKLPPYIVYEPEDYRDGPEGFITWCEDNVCIPVYPEGTDIAIWTPISQLSHDIHPRSGKSYDYIWQMQKEEVRQCLRMVNGRFIYRLIIFCWMRGEGKSLLACLIQLWKFYNWPKQTITLGANSKDQIRFVHYDIMRDIIKNSPNLLAIVGERNIQEKEIRMRDDSGNVTSVIRPISSFSGIVSNITGYTFSEIFDMKNPKFFTQLDGSIRNIPNALGVIDSTVSPKQHVLYKMYQAFITRETKTLFFSYRCSKTAVVEDYWNPNMDQQQLDDYRAKFPLGEFEKYFMNTWGSNAQQVFTEKMLFCTNYIGTHGVVTTYHALLEVVNERFRVKDAMDDLIRTGRDKYFTFQRDLAKIKQIEKTLLPITSVYSLSDEYGHSRMMTIAELDRFTEFYDTNWSVHIGLDRADPLKHDRTQARTIVEIVAKGLPGSRSNPMTVDNGNPQYLYLRLGIVHVADSMLDSIKDVILEAHHMYDGVDSICGERWGIWDLGAWCELHNIRLEIIHPSYDKQKTAFSEVHGAISSGRFKTAPVPIWGSKEEDIFKEEASVFYHDDEKKWFGSPEKMEKNGVQDDVMFALGWCIYGGRDFGLDHFRERSSSTYFGTMVLNRNHVANH